MRYTKLWSEEKYEKRLQCGYLPLVFPQAVISLDRFHVIQDLINHMMETYTDVRKRPEVEEKHERAAYYKKVDECVKNRKRYRKNNPKNYKGKKRGCKPKYRKSDFKPYCLKSPCGVRGSIHKITVVMYFKSKWLTCFILFWNL